MIEEAQEPKLKTLALVVTELTSEIRNLETVVYGPGDLKLSEADENPVGLNDRLLRLINEIENAMSAIQNLNASLTQFGHQLG